MKTQLVTCPTVMRLIAGALLAGSTFISGIALAAEAGSAGNFSAKTPWGDPDLQGIWSYASLTPLQRPARLENREFYSPEEAAAINDQSLDEPGDRPGDPGTYNVEWFDRGSVSADLRTSLIVDPPDGRLPFRPGAEEQWNNEQDYRSSRDTDSWVFRSNWDRCITYHGVPPISTGYNNTYQIVQAQGYVAIYVEMIHDVRIIPLDDKPRLHDNIRQWNGDSRGYWDGDTLVVETSNYSANTQHRFPSSPGARAVERFTRVSEDMIDYQFTFEDPELYSQPWTAVRPMPRLDDYTIYEYACHEGNYAMANILRGARVMEQREQDASESN